MAFVTLLQACSFDLKAGRTTVKTLELYIDCGANSFFIIACLSPIDHTSHHSLRPLHTDMLLTDSVKIFTSSFFFFSSSLTFLSSVSFSFSSTVSTVPLSCAP